MEKVKLKITCEAVIEVEPEYFSHLGDFIDNDSFNAAIARDCQQDLESHNYILDELLEGYESTFKVEVVN